MTLRCDITGTCRATGNNVSHSNHKTRRVFKANLHKRRVWNEATGRYETLTLSLKGLKIIDKMGLEAAKKFKNQI